MHSTVFDKSIVDPIKIAIIYFHAPAVCSTAGINRLYGRYILLSTQYLSCNMFNCINVKNATPTVMT